MNLASILSLLPWIIAASEAYNIALFVPAMAASQVIWNIRVGEELAKAGHKITLIHLRIANITLHETKVMDGIEQWRVDAFAVDYAEIESKHSKMIFRDYSFFEPEVRGMLSLMTNAFIDGCELILQNVQFMERLKAAKFDVAFAPMYEFCPIGLIHAANVPTWIWLNSGQLMDIVAEYIGVPSPPSYVPMMMADSSDEMTFIERLKSFIGRIITPIIADRMLISHQTKLFRKYIDPHFPDLVDLAKLCPLVMVNSNELYNLPRPTLHKIVYIGGLGMKNQDAKPLNGRFKEIADNAKRIAVMTFGSHANSSAMPQSWKKAFLESFRKFPDVDFIVRYTAKDLIGKTSNNVHLKSWIPQSDLLQHKKTVLLITHGGYNSLQEAINSGVPLLTIPLFGDQPGNAKLAVKRGFGYSLTKGDITTEKVTKALQAVLQNPSYMESAVRMQNMVRKKPSQPERLLVRWTEFIAEFKQLPNLVPYGTKLNFIQYHCIDVIAFLSFITAIVVFVVVKVVRFTCCFVYKKVKGDTRKRKAE